MTEAGVFIALGANLGDRQATLAAARTSIDRINGVRILANSQDYETDPVGGPPDQPKYLNAVIEISCELTPEDLLAELQRIEAEFGRQRTVVDGPRTLDLDLLLFAERVIDAPRLSVPHPRMWQRDFVTDPLREICGSQRFDDLRARFTE